nr:glycosyltransferase family 4 protein [Alicyclobacillus mengziensis]
MHSFQYSNICTINRDKPVRLLYVGRLVHPKGVQYLINAVYELTHSSSHTSFTCEIVGDGWYHESLKALVHNLGITEYITFSGRVAGYQTEDKYIAADIVVVPSIWPDPAPLVVPEARRFGKPVVVFDAGGLPEWAKILGGVHVAQHADAHDLAMKILEVVDMYSDPEGTTTPKVRCPALIERLDLLNEIEYFTDTTRA